MGGHDVLLLVAACCCFTELVRAGDQVVLNPLQRALFELRDAYAQPDDGDLCGGSAAINAECGVCEALGSSPDDVKCCTDVDAFAHCHLRVVELMGEIDMLEKNVIKPKYMDEAVMEFPDKRYGSVFSNWNWFSNKQGNRVNKRFGNLFGNVMQSNGGGTHKRYGNLFGHMLTSGGRPKRYGNMFGNVFAKNRNAGGTQ